jgi:hypothetical protein
MPTVRHRNAKHLGKRAERLGYLSICQAQAGAVEARTCRAACRWKHIRSKRQPIYVPPDQFSQCAQVLRTSDLLAIRSGTVDAEFGTMSGGK